MRFGWLKICLTLLFLLTGVVPLAAQSATEHFRAYTSDGKPTTLGEIAARLAAYDALIIGEKHDDASMKLKLRY